MIAIILYLQQCSLTNDDNGATVGRFPINSGVDCIICKDEKDKNVWLVKSIFIKLLLFRNKSRWDYYYVLWWSNGATICGLFWVVDSFKYELRNLQHLGNINGPSLRLKNVKAFGAVVVGKCSKRSFKDGICVSWHLSNAPFLWNFKRPFSKTLLRDFFFNSVATRPLIRPLLWLSIIIILFRIVSMCGGLKENHITRRNILCQGNLASIHGTEEGNHRGGCCWFISNNLLTISCLFMTRISNEKERILSWIEGLWPILFSREMLSFFRRW